MKNIFTKRGQQITRMFTNEIDILIINLRSFVQFVDKKIVLLLVFLLLFSCSRRTEQTQEYAYAEAAPYEYILAARQLPPAPEPVIEEATTEQPEAVPAAEPPRILPRAVAIPPNARPGEPVTIALSYYFAPAALAAAAPHHQNLRAVLLDSRQRRITRASFFSLPGEDRFKTAIIAIPSTALIGEASILIEAVDGSSAEKVKQFPFTIDYRSFLSETIYLDPVNTALRTTPDPQRTAESQLLWQILNRTGTEIFSDGHFIRPVTATRRTSFFGSRRVFQYSDGGSDTTIHFGVDYGVPTGTEVRASGRGRVVLARSRIITGNSVVIEHLPGVFSLYYHLNEIIVTENSIVEAGTLLGYSGATGLATGPHLHWEIRVSGENADPDAFLSRPLLDKNLIIDKLMGSTP